MSRTSGLASAAIFLGLWASNSARADEFVPPPEAEREIVATTVKLGGRVQIDADYRVTYLQLGVPSTDEQLKNIEACERLTQLVINCRNVTDVGLERLKPLKKLTSINIYDSGVTPAGVAALRAALPDCRITAVTARVPAGGPGGARPGVPVGERGGLIGGAFGGPGSGSLSARRPGELLRTAAIQDELKLNDEQREKIAEHGPASFAAFQQAQEQKTLAVLTEAQQLRLKQLEIQQFGYSAVARPEIARELKLTDEQVTAVQKQYEDSTGDVRTALSEIFRARPAVPNADNTQAAREKIAEVGKARDEKIHALLNEEQRQAWDQLIGPKGPSFGSASLFTTAVGALDRERDRERGGGGAGGRPGGTTAPAAYAKAIAKQADADGNGILTEAELPAGNRWRKGLADAGLEVRVPLTCEEFESLMVKLMESQRPKP